jgi:hypothetical protein
MKKDRFVSRIILAFLLSFPLLTFSQEWIRTFSNSNKSVITKQILESYDHGYLLGADITAAYGGGLLKTGWILKLDVNGNVLWDRKLGNGVNMWNIEGMDVTPDGGMIVTGYSDSLDAEWFDPWVTKLNACGEIEWCRVFHSDNDLNGGHDIISLPDNSYICLLSNWGNTFPEPSVWLVHLDQTGEIIWEQEYFANDSLMNSETPISLTITPDSHYLVSGMCYYPDSGQVSPWWVQPMLIMADSTGEMVWEIAWGYANNCGGEGFQSIVTGNANSIYTSIGRYPHGAGTGYQPALIKTSCTGMPDTIKNLKDSTEFGKASTITSNSDSVLFIGAGYTLNGIDNLSVCKTDTLGNVIKEKILNHAGYIAIDATLTQDEKYLITANNVISNKTIFYLWKLTSDLEFDSIYTQPLTYDSLCPHAIVSDTLFFQCDVITGMQEPAKDTEKVRMKVYPNPARETVHVQMPQCIQRETTTTHLTVTTIFRQWSKPLHLEVYDGFGRLITRQQVQPDEKEVMLQVASWSPGVYLLRLVYLDTLVATEKLVVE